MQHDLDRLGPGGFQDLVAALMVAEFGARLKSLGAGRDGGRDMMLHGSIDWAGSGRSSGSQPAPPPRPATTTADDIWSGFIVFQSKHHSPLAARPIDNARWLWQEMRKELDLWTKPPPTRSRTPDYLVFVTNVPLSPDPVNGGLALIEQSLADYRTRLEDGSRDIASGERLAQLARLNLLKAVRVVDGNQVDALVSVHGPVRQSFSALLTVGDVFASLRDRTDR